MGVGLSYPTGLKTRPIELSTSLRPHKHWLEDFTSQSVACLALLRCCPKLGVPWAHRCPWSQPSSDRKVQIKDPGQKFLASSVPRRGSHRFSIHLSDPELQAAVQTALFCLFLPTAQLKCHILSFLSIHREGRELAKLLC